MKKTGKLNKAQSKRLYDIIKDYKLDNGLSLRGIKKRTTVSLGRLGMLNPYTPSYNPCTLGITLQICKDLDINPYYILENKYPKYIRWKEVFHDKGIRYHS